MQPRRNSHGGGIVYCERIRHLLVSCQPIPNDTADNLRVGLKSGLSQIPVPDSLGCKLLTQDVLPRARGPIDNNARGMNYPLAHNEAAQRALFRRRAGESLEPANSWLQMNAASPGANLYGVLGLPSMGSFIGSRKTNIFVQV